MSDQPQGPGSWQASDGKWYPAPTQPAAPLPPPPQPPGYGYAAPPPGYPMPLGYPPPASDGMPGCLKWGLIVGGVLVVLFAVGVFYAVSRVDDVVDEIGDDLVEEQQREARDVTLADCRVQADTNFMEVVLDVTNSSSERSNYIVTVAFESVDGSQQFDTTTVFVNQLEPGQSTEASSASFTEPPGDFDCDIGEVERFSDERDG